MSQAAPHHFAEPRLLCFESDKQTTDLKFERLDREF
jgi:hypothetical protein